MVVKGIIKSIDFNGNSCTVRMPYFETAGSAEVVSEALISNVPGIYNGYKENDVVWVAFDEGMMEAPVVIGKLYLGAAKEKTDPRGTINCETQNVSKTASIPFDTKLGANLDDKQINTRAPFGSLESLASNLNRVDTEQGQNNRDLGNRLRSVVDAIGPNGELIYSIIDQQADNINAKVSKDSTKDVGASTSFGWNLDLSSWTVYNTPSATDLASRKKYYLDNVLVEVKKITGATQTEDKIFINNVDTNLVVKWTKTQTAGAAVFTILGVSKGSTEVISTNVLSKLFSKIRPKKSLYEILVDYVKKENNRIKTDISEFVNYSNSIIPAEEDKTASLLYIPAENNIENSNWFIRTGIAASPASYTNTEVQIKYQPLLYVDQDVARFTGTLSTNKGNLGAFNIGALHELKLPTGGSTEKIHSGLYSNGYINKYDASVENKNGIYLGTDGIKLGDKFSIDIYGNVTAKSLILSTDETIANSVNLQGGNATGTESAIFYKNDSTRKVVEINDVDQTFTDSGIDTYSIFSGAKYYRIPVYKNNTKQELGIIFKALDEPLKNDSYYALSFILNYETITSTENKILKVIPFIIDETKANSFKDNVNNWSGNEWNMFRHSPSIIAANISDSKILSVLPNTSDTRYWKYGNYKLKNAESINYTQLLELTKNGEQLFKTNYINTTLGDTGASYSSCELYDQVNFLSYSCLLKGTDLNNNDVDINVISLFNTSENNLNIYTDSYFKATKFTALFKTHPTQTMEKAYIGLYILVDGGSGSTTEKFTGFITIKDVKLESGKNVSPFTLSTSDGNLVRNVGIVDIISDDNSTDTTWNSRSVGTNISWPYSGYNIDIGSFFLLMGTATDTKDVHTLSCRCIQKSSNSITGDILAHTKQLKGIDGKDGKDGQDGRDGQDGTNGKSITAKLYYNWNSNPNTPPTPLPDISGGVLTPNGYGTTPLTPDASHHDVWACTITFEDNVPKTVSTAYLYSTYDGMVSILTANGINIISEDQGQYYIKADHIDGALSDKVTVAGFTIGTNSLTSSDNQIYLGTDKLQLSNSTSGSEVLITPATGLTIKGKDGNDNENVVKFEKVSYITNDGTTQYAFGLKSTINDAEKIKLSPKRLELDSNQIIDLSTDGDLRFGDSGEAKLNTIIAGKDIILSSENASGEEHGLSYSRGDIWLGHKIENYNCPHITVNYDDAYGNYTTAILKGPSNIVTYGVAGGFASNKRIVIEIYGVSAGSATKWTNDTWYHVMDASNDDHILYASIELIYKNKPGLGGTTDLGGLISVISDSGGEHLWWGNDRGDISTSDVNVRAFIVLEHVDIA